MIHVLVVAVFIVLSFAIGFGLGRVKDARKLAAARAALNSLEAGASHEGRTIISFLRAKL